ncbi:MAG: glycosyltransferase [Proteobacteria bacterium]|nr:glycosyltransferase [Pseudomonadota bacterium]
MKICQLCAVDFTFHYFLSPLARALAEAGHEVVGVFADGPFAERIRGQGVRVETVPFSRDLDLGNHVRVYRRLVALFRAERFDVVHAHTPVAAFIARFAAWRAGVPRIVYTAHGFYFHERMAWPRRAAVIALEWLAGRVTDVLFTQAEEDADAARRLGLCRGGTIEAIGNGVDPARCYPADDGGEGRRAPCRRAAAPYPEPRSAGASGSSMRDRSAARAGGREGCRGGAGKARRSTGVRAFCGESRNTRNRGQTDDSRHFAILDNLKESLKIKKLRIFKADYIAIFCSRSYSRPPGAAW